MASFRMDWPPSVNTIWRQRVIVPKGRAPVSVTYLSAKGKAYRLAAVGLTDAKFDRPVRVLLEFIEPNRRKRDLDNHVKAVFDALEYAGVLADDTLVDDCRFVRRGVEGPGCVDVTIELME